jgi:chromate transporter
LIDDHTPTPDHARHNAIRLYRQLSIGVLLWLIPLVALILIEGWKSLYPQIAWFFTKAAFLTFGGAYAVLPYVFQGAVEHYQWLTAPQMMDGLALGEAKPGPLIMVVAFVGFLAGFANDTVLGGLGFWGGALGALVATWFTFLPSFLFIFLGAPLIESTHGNVRFTAPLTAISAAVVGVIANLGVFFAYQVFFPKGFSGGLSVFALLICLGSLLLMLRLQWGVIRTLGLAGLLGILFAANGGLFS